MLCANNVDNFVCSFKKEINNVISISLTTIILYIKRGRLW